VRHREAIEPFIGNSALTKLQQAADLLQANELSFLTDPALDQDDVKLAGTLTRARIAVAKTKVCLFFIR